MLDPETGAVTFEYGNSEYTMVFDMKATHFFERETDMSLVDALDELEEAKKANKTPKVSTMAYLMQASLRRHHPEISAERALRMAQDPTVLEALGLGLEAAAPVPDEDELGNVQTPPSAGKSSTTTTSSAGRSKRA